MSAVNVRLLKFCGAQVVQRFDVVRFQAAVAGDVGAASCKGRRLVVAHFGDVHYVHGQHVVEVSGVQRVWKGERPAPYKTK